jgi:hypothetical protein
MSAPVKAKPLELVGLVAPDAPVVVPFGMVTVAVTVKAAPFGSVPTALTEFAPNDAAIAGPPLMLMVGPAPHETDTVTEPSAAAVAVAANFPSTKNCTVDPGLKPVYVNEPVEPTGHVNDNELVVAIVVVVGGYPGVAARAGAPMKRIAPTTAAAPTAISLRIRFGLSRSYPDPILGTRLPTTKKSNTVYVSIPSFVRLSDEQQVSPY